MYILQIGECNCSFCTHIYICIYYRLGSVIVVSALVWVYVCFLIRTLLFSHIKEITTFCCLSYICMSVGLFRSFHCRALLKSPTGMCLYLIYSGQGLHCRRTCQVNLDIFESPIDFQSGSRTINATSDPEFMKYKSVLNLISDGCQLHIHTRSL